MTKNTVETKSLITKISLMTKIARRYLLSASVMGLALTGVSPVVAQTWPNHPIRLIVAFPPGNAADMIARAFGNGLSQKLGQPVVIENKGGAGGVIGVDAMSKSAPDGYTFGVTSLSPITIIPAIKKDLPYDPINGLMPVTLLGQGPLVILVRKDSPINSVQELIEQSKANPGKFTYGSLGPGTVSQMNTELFKAASGADLTEISYKGSAQALTDLVGGHITMMIDGVVSGTAQIKAGNLKALAVTTLKRNALLPDVVTLDETGIASLAGYNSFGWIGMFAPPGTPKEIVARMQQELMLIAQTPEVIKQVNSGGLDVPDANTPSQFAEFLKQDLSRWTKVAKDLNLSSN